MNQDTIVARLQEMYNRFNGEKLSEEDIRIILNVSQIRTYLKGEIIQGIQQPLIYTGLILEGITRSYYLDTEGNDITKFFSIEGSIIMDEGLLGYEQSFTALEALEDSMILLMNTQKLKQLIKTKDTIKNLYIACLEYALRYKIYREREFLSKSATERYQQFCRDYPELINRVKQSYISTYLGIKPESLSRIRKTLKEI